LLLITKNPFDDIKIHYHSGSLLAKLPAPFNICAKFLFLLLYAKDPDLEINYRNLFEKHIGL
jgi:hypothetical protein